MKKFISMICLMLTFTTLLCACDGDTLNDPSESSDVQTTESAATSAEESITVAPTPTVKSTYVDFDGTVTAKAKRIDSLKIKAFAGEGGYYKHSQGGCIVGDYLYTCMHSPAANGLPEKACIVKTNLLTAKVVAKSENMVLGHANDAAYNPDDNVLVIADCGSNGHNIIYVVDPDTLEIKETRTLKRGTADGTTICAIAYDSVNKRYIAIGAQNDYVYIYSRTFGLQKVIKGFGMTKGDPYKGDFSEQGILTDGTYLYILEWHGGSKWAELNSTVESEVRANILVMDLSTGKYVTTIDTGIKRELEFMGYRKGKFYIGCNNINWNGMEFYEVEITTKK